MRWVSYNETLFSLSWMVQICDSALFLPSLTVYYDLVNCQSLIFFFVLLPLVVAVTRVARGNSIFLHCAIRCVDAMFQNPGPQVWRRCFNPKDTYKCWHRAQPKAKIGLNSTNLIVLLSTRNPWNVTLMYRVYTACTLFKTSFWKRH